MAITTYRNEFFRWDQRLLALWIGDLINLGVQRVHWGRKKRITVENVSFGGSARLRTGLLTDRPREICERISKSSRAHRSSCHMVSALQRKEWPLLHEETLVERNRSTTGRFGGDLGFNWNLKLALREVIDWSRALTLTARLACLGGGKVSTEISSFTTSTLIFVVKLMTLEDDRTLKGW